MVLACQGVHSWKVIYFLVSYKYNSIIRCILPRVSGYTAASVQNISQFVASASYYRIHLNNFLPTNFTTSIIRVFFLELSSVSLSESWNSPLKCGSLIDYYFIYIMDLYHYLFKFIIVGDTSNSDNISRCWKELHPSQLHRRQVQGRT